MMRVPPLTLTLYMDLKLFMYSHQDALESSKKFSGISDTYDVFKTLSMPDFYVNLQFLAPASVKMPRNL